MYSVAKRRASCFAWSGAGADDEAFCMWAGAGADLVARRARAIKGLIPGAVSRSCMEDRAKSDFPLLLGLVAAPIRSQSQATRF